MIEKTDWTEAYLQYLIDTKENESLILDYKSSDALQNNDQRKNEISKDISSFGNSAGGVIIYGIIEKDNIPERIDNGVNPKLITKEWLEQVINTRIQRRIQAIKIFPVELVSQNNGHVAYVVTIPQSIYAPHQANDKKFYKRFNFMSVPMEEYEIRDVLNRSTSPDLELKIEIIEKNINDENTAKVNIQPILINNSNCPAEYINIMIFLESTVTSNLVSLGFVTGSEEKLTLNNGKTCSGFWYIFNYAIPHRLPAFKGLNIRVPDTPIELIYRTTDNPLLGWRLSSPKMEPKTGFMQL